MEITIENHDGKYPSFDINLHSAPGADPFIVIKGCRIAEGSKGPFVSYPATKNATTGKYWNHVYGGEKFNEAVLKLAQRQESPKRPSHDAVKARQLDDDSIPF